MKLVKEKTQYALDQAPEKFGESNVVLMRNDEPTIEMREKFSEQAEANPEELIKMSTRDFSQIFGTYLSIAVDDYPELNKWLQQPKKSAVYLDATLKEIDNLVAKCFVFPSEYRNLLRANGMMS